MSSNGNRYIITADGKSVTLDRDLDKLYRQYANLIYSIYQKHGWKLNSKAKRDDLQSYIDYQFVVLTKEFNISGNVDYPYYIKTKLNMRVHSYVDRLLGKEQNEFLGNKDDTVEVLAEEEYEDIDYKEMYDYVIKQGNFNKLQTDILDKFIYSDNNTRDSKIISELAKEHGVTREYIKNEIDDIKEYIRLRCSKFYDLTVYKNHKVEGRVSTQNNVWE